MNNRPIANPSYRFRITNVNIPIRINAEIATPSDVLSEEINKRCHICLSFRKGALLATVIHRQNQKMIFHETKTDISISELHYWIIFTMTNPKIDIPLSTRKSSGLFMMWPESCIKY